MDELGAQIEFENVICRHQLRRQRAGKKKTARGPLDPDADVPESVQTPSRRGFRLAVATEALIVSVLEAMFGLKASRGRAL